MSPLNRVRRALATLLALAESTGAQQGPPQSLTQAQAQAATATEYMSGVTWAPSTKPKPLTGGAPATGKHRAVRPSVITM